MTAKLNNITVRGTDYQYIEYGEDSREKTSVDGLVIPITPTVKGKLLYVGGFYQDLLTPLREDTDNQIERIVVLSVTERGMSQLTGFFFDDGSEDMKTSWTKEPSIAAYYKTHIDDKDISYESINSLEFLANLTNDDSKKYLNILALYYNPIAPNDTGIIIDGKIVPYGKTVVIDNFKVILDKFESIRNSSLGKLNVNKIVLDIYDEGPRLMGTIGSGKIYNEEGKVISSIEDYYHRFVNTEDNKLNYEEFLEDYIKDELHLTALTIERRLRGNPENKEKIIDEHVKKHERDMEEDYEPATEMMGLNLLLECIERKLVRVANV